MEPSISSKKAAACCRGFGVVRKKRDMIRRGFISRHGFSPNQIIKTEVFIQYSFANALSLNMDEHLPFFFLQQIKI